jgi:endonuclease/exonuclease/phosphatase family metal-dependent hydrolase
LLLGLLASSAATALLAGGCTDDDDVGGATACPNACTTSSTGSGGEAGNGGNPTGPGGEGGGGLATGGAGGGTPDGGAPGKLRLMTYNIRAGLESSLGDIADVILAEAPDFVALEEVDKDADRSGNVDQAYRLGQLTGMASLFRSAFDFSSGGSYGLALLARYPILTSDKLELTSSGEQRILILVTIELEPGLLITLAVTHMDLDATTRATQADEIVTRLAAEPYVVLSGDLNEQVGGDAIDTLTGAYDDAWAIAGDGDGFTFPSDLPDRRIDYVLLGAPWATPTDAWVPVSTASDHRPIVVDVPRPGG